MLGLLRYFHSSAFVSTRTWPKSVDRMPQQNIDIASIFHSHNIYVSWYIYFESQNSFQVVRRPISQRNLFQKVDT